MSGSDDATRSRTARAALTGDRFRLSADEARARKSPNPGPIEALFFAHRGRPVQKWVHYLPFYDQVLAPYRHRPVRMLEIGVMWGGSLELWRAYFGPDAAIFGVDIDPDCAQRADPPNQVRIGSQADAGFLRDVVAEMGGVDIVLDDGSHMAGHQRASFETLWPLLSAGGIYIIEDMHTSYWPGWEGGLGKPGTAADLIKALVDDVNGQYHAGDPTWAPYHEIGGIMVGDSIAAIMKSEPRPRSGCVWAGDPAKMASAARPAD